MGPWGLCTQPASFWLPEPAAEGLHTFTNVPNHNVQASNQKISRCAKKQEKVINEEKNEPIDTDSEIKNTW